MLLDNIIEMGINGKAVSSLYYMGKEIWSITPASGLASYSWKEISTISKAGTMDEYFAIGETKKVTLSDGTTATFCYIGKENDSSGTLGMTFMQIDNFITSKWHTSTSSWKTYAASTISSNVDSYLFNSDVYTYLRTVTKRHKSSNSSSTSTRTSTYFSWIPSLYELTGSTELTSPNISNGVTYPYTATEEFKSKIVNTTGLNYMWLRNADSTGYSYRLGISTSLASFADAVQYVMTSSWTTTLIAPVLFCV